MLSRSHLHGALVAVTFTLLFRGNVGRLYSTDNAVPLAMDAQRRGYDAQPFTVALNSLYENLLQREYASPSLFANREERKALRSPSLRLRFGRSDPDVPLNADKRWLGDVQQKPIRSPSLRLRFGRRNDPSMSLHAKIAAAPGNAFNAYKDFLGFDPFKRKLRKPQRLRWGRSVSYKPNAKDEQMAPMDDEFNSFDGPNSDMMRNMVSYLGSTDDNGRDEDFDEVYRDKNADLLADDVWESEDMKLPVEGLHDV